MDRRLKMASVWVTCVLLGSFLYGCALVQNNPVTACQQKPVCSAYGAYAMAGRATADALRAGDITVNQAKSVQSALNKVRPLIDGARRSVEAGEPTHDEMRSVQDGLRNVRQMLQEYEHERD